MLAFSHIVVTPRKFGVIIVTLLIFLGMRIGNTLNNPYFGLCCQSGVKSKVNQNVTFISLFHYSYMATYMLLSVELGILLIKVNLLHDEEDNVYSEIV